MHQVIVADVTDEKLHQSAADELYTAIRTVRSIAPLTETYENLSIDDAYQISLSFLNRRLADGEKVVGKKIGVTSAPVMNMLGVDQPDFGFLTDAMWVQDNVVDTSAMILPRAEAEIAFRLQSDLKGPGVSEADVLAATDGVAACFEIVDSRIRNWQIKIQDTIADNASCGAMVIGENWVDPRKLDLQKCEATVTKNGSFLSAGKGEATLGSPLTAVAWLANTLGERGIPFLAGEIILSGSLVALEPVKPGDEMSVSIDGIGSCEVRFS